MTREEAIRWLEDIHRRFNPTGENLENEGGDVHLQALDMAIEALSAEPKTKCVAQIRIDRNDMEDLVNEKVNEMVDKMSEPKTGWIPVSERLPAEDGEYLVAYPIALGDAETEVDILNYGKPTIPNEKVGGRCWYDTDAMYGDIVYDDVVAWMPLPVPYKGGEEE